MYGTGKVIGSITINMDEKCKRCGKRGAVNGKICLDCALENARTLNKDLRKEREKQPRRPRT